jgi:hypothetical protein
LYDQNTLNSLKSLKKTNNKALAVIFNMIQNFSNQSKVKMLQIIKLLLHKITRNFKAHGVIQRFINDVVNNKRSEDDIIQYIEDTRY